MPVLTIGDRLRSRRSRPVYDQDLAESDMVAPRLCAAGAETSEDALSLHPCSWLELRKSCGAWVSAMRASLGSRRIWLQP